MTDIITPLQGTPVTEEAAAVVDTTVDTSSETVAAPVASETPVEAPVEAVQPQTTVEATIVAAAPESSPSAVVEPSEPAPFVRDTSGEDDIDRAIDLYVNVPMVPELRALLKQAVMANPDRLLGLIQYVNYGILDDALGSVIELNV